MKQKLLSLLALILLAGLNFTISFAQDEIWGIAINGGPKGGGTVFSLKNDGTAFSVRKSFISEGNSPNGDLTLGTDGQFYGMTSLGGSYNGGTIFRVKSDGSGFVVLHELNPITDGGGPMGSLTQGPDGKFYGLTHQGGLLYAGTIFRINGDGSGFTVLRHLNYGVDGSSPYENLTWGTNGYLYGMTSIGGTNNGGTIFRINSSGTDFAVLQHLTKAEGFIPQGSLTLGSDGQLYGMTTLGGSAENGTIFRMKQDGSGFTVLRHLNGSTDGSGPKGSLMLGANGQFYGMAYGGGTYNAGTIFRMNPDGSNFTVLRALNFSEAGYPSGNLTQDAAGVLYGMTSSGGLNNDGNGTIFRMNPDGSSFMVLRTMLYATDAVAPQGSFTLGANGKLYGMSGMGNNQRTGAIFRINTDGSDYTTLRTIEKHPEGVYPKANLIQGTDGFFYGMTTRGGSNGDGVIFRLNSDGSGAAVLHNFSGNSSGVEARGGLMQGSDGRLYGVTYQGGSYRQGTIFRINRDGSGFTNLRNLRRATDGGSPMSVLTQGADGRIYGMTAIGGINNGGTIFRITNDGSGFTVLRSLNNSTEGFSLGSLTQGSDGWMYGACTAGNMGGGGKIFRINTDGSVFTILKSLDTVTEGANPSGGLTQGTDGKLYGSAREGGSYGNGTLFRMNTDGSSFTVLRHLNSATDGAFPRGAMVPGNTGQFYGTTAQGGSKNAGTVFRINADGSGFTVLRHLDLAADGGNCLGSLVVKTNQNQCATGTILREVWTKVTGASVAAVPVGDVPDSTSQLSLFEAPSNAGDNYGSRIRGYVCVPMSGNYTFWIASDNEAELYLSSDENPGNKVKIATSTGYPRPRQWDYAAGQQSAPVALVAGRKYYIEALHKEAYGSDNLAVGWQMPDGTLERPISGYRLSPFVPQVASCSATGQVLREVWYNVSGVAIADIPLSSPPASITFLDSLRAPANIGDRYAQRLRGYICAPQTGSYTFWLISDNEGELYLSTDDNPANKQLQAYIRGGSAYPGEWGKYPTQKSATVQLVAGQRYYLEVLHKEGYGSDHLIVGWQTPRSLANAKPIVIPGSVLSPFVPGNARMEYAEVANAEAAAGLNLQAAPNPFTHQTTVSFTAQESGQAVLDLYDLQGKKLQQVFKADVQAREQQRAQVNGSGLGQGLYLLRLVNGSQMQHLKVLVNQ